MAACPNCGRVSEPQDRFCRSCGTALVAETPPATPAAVPAEKPEFMIVLVGAATVALLALAAVYAVSGSSLVFFACCVPSAVVLLFLAIVGAVVGARRKGVVRT